MGKLLEYFKGDELAANVWKSKYAYAGEETPNDMHKRMAVEFTKVEQKYLLDEPSVENENDLETINKLSKYGRKRENLTEDKIYELFKDFKYLIPQGSILSTLGTPIIASLSNCWVVESPEDSYAGIHKSDGDLIYYYKRRGGCGLDISNLRPKDTSTNNTAKTSTGAVSFMHRFSNTTREVAMNGRRGALMLSIDINHPDVMDFIKIKRDGTSVTGANISIRINNEFMQAVENDGDYILRFPCNESLSNTLDYDSFEYNTLYSGVHEGTHFKKIKAKEYWDEIIKSAHGHAEPGIMFWDNALEYDPAAIYEQYRPISTNPCVTGDTIILTREYGYKKIEDCLNTSVEIWNGYEWSEVTPYITGHNQHILEISLSDGRTLKCTDYHKWILKDGERVEAINLKIGDKLSKYSFPIIKGGEQVDGRFAYTQGFISADGQDNYNYLWLYEPKFSCEERLLGTGGKEYPTSSGTFRKQIRFSEQFNDKHFIPYSWDLNGRLNWLAGLIDGDGTELIEGGLQIWSISFDFLTGVQNILSTLGVNSKILSGKDSEIKSIPDGKNNFKEYFCKESFRICVGAVEMQGLKSLGLKCERLSFDKCPNRSAQRFVTIKSIKDGGYADTVYCFNEPKNNSGIFNGILTAQCGEQYLQANDSCRLMVHNLLSYVKNPFTSDAEFDVDKFYKNVYEGTRLGDDLVDLEAEYIQRIIDKILSDPEPDEIKRQELELWKKSKDICLQGRRVGMGITALGDTIAALGLGYDSEEGLLFTEQLMHIKMEAELDCNIDLAILRGSFKGWDSKKEFTLLEGLDTFYMKGRNEFYQFLQDNFSEQVNKMLKHGRRNISWSTIAPTGSVSLLANNCTSGCEPLFQPFYMRRKKVNNDSERVDFVDEIGDKWQEFPVLHPNFKEWVLKKYCFEENTSPGGIVVMEEEKETEFVVENLPKEKLQELFEQSPWYGSTANDIDWEKRVEMQAILQKYTTNAISSTVNLPSTVTPEEVSTIYMESWKKGLKGITVYVDGSRSGVLVTEPAKELVTFNENHAPKRPKSLACKVVRFNNNYEKWIAFVGLLDNKPYEVFTGKAENVELSSVVEVGEIKKIKDENGNKRYDFIYEGGVVENISRVSSADYWNYGKLISSMLRHGMPLPFVVDTIQSLTWDNDHINTWKAGIARALKKFIKDGKAVGFTCSDCGSTDVVFEEGCNRCKNCGSSQCG